MGERFETTGYKHIALLWAKKLVLIPLAPPETGFSTHRPLFLLHTVHTRRTRYTTLLKSPHYRHYDTSKRCRMKGAG